MKRKTLVRVMVAFTCGALVGGLAGCYERVVRAEGLGAQGVAVQKPYRSETALDKAFFPENRSSNDGFSQPSSNSNR
ncbi:MAG: hypothetical protein KF691_03260 [Phycisphaeraceae bacterium]|nr:hypothetical protein [Phycisphaeraceae bacterium]